MEKRKTIFTINSREEYLQHKSAIYLYEKDPVKGVVICDAVKNRQFEKVEWLLEEGFDLSRLSDLDTYFLFDKTQYNEPLQNLLIYHGLSLQPSEFLYRNNLNKAYKAASVEILKMLIEAKNPLFIHNDREDYSMIIGEVKHDYAMWEYITTLTINDNLMSRKMSIDEVLNEQNETLLFFLDKREDIEKVLELGADINATNMSGETALFSADFEKSKILIEKGIDINNRCNAGLNAMCSAVKENNKEKLALLVNAGIDTNISFYKEEPFIDPDELCYKEQMRKHNPEMYIFLQALEENKNLNEHLNKEIIEKMQDFEKLKKRL